MWMKPNAFHRAVVAALRCCTDLPVRRPGQGLLKSPGRSIYGGIWATAFVTGQGNRRQVAVRAAVNAACLTPALSGEFMGVAQPPVTRRGRPGRSGLIHGAVGPLSSRTTSRQPIVTIERTVSVHPLSRSSHRRPATIDAPRKPPARARYLVGNSGERRETRPQLRPGRRPLHPEARSNSRRGRELSVNSVRGRVPECAGSLIR